MSKINLFQKAIGEYENILNELNKKYDDIIKEHKQAINLSAEKEIGKTKITVRSEFDPPFTRGIILSIGVVKPSYDKGIALNVDEGQALYEILKELYE